MAIPITCPGCQATFEVPEGLAGKTIRCTSCKTQLTVAAAKARSAAPLSLDNPAPPAKSAPAANGKATVAKSVRERPSRWLTTTMMMTLPRRPVPTNRLPRAARH